MLPVSNAEAGQAGAEDGGAVPHWWFRDTMHMGNLYWISKALAQERQSHRQAKLRQSVGTFVSKA